MTPPAVILNFHGIGAPHAGIAADERPYWIDEAGFRAIADAVASHPARARIGLTFDDGNASDLAIAAPILASHGLKAAFFVLAGRLGQDHYLSAADCRSLLAMGMEIGLHGRSHVDWRQLDAAGLADETQAARAELAAAAGCAVDSVAIPFGAYNRRVIAQLRSQGFARILTSDGGRAGRGPVLSRTSLRAGATPAQVAAIVEGRESPLQRLRRGLSTLLRRNLI